MRRIFALLAALLLLPACAGDGTPDGAAETPPPPVFLEEEAGEPGIPGGSERLDEIRALLAAGRPGEALLLIQALEEDMDRGADARRILAPLRLDARRRLRTAACDARVHLDASRVAAGTPITGALAIGNAGAGVLVLRDRHRQDGAASRSIFQILIRYREFDIGGVVVEEASSRSMLLGRDIEIPPGERIEIPIVIDSAEFGRTSVNYREYGVEAVLLPASFSLGGEAIPGTIRFEPAVCGVFPRNYEHLADNPLSRMREAAEKDSAPHLCLAAALLPEAGRPDGEALLFGILGAPGKHSESILRAACVALRILTGEEIGPSPDLWLAWSDSRKTR